MSRAEEIVSRVRRDLERSLYSSKRRATVAKATFWKLSQKDQDKLYGIGRARLARAGMPSWQIEAVSEPLVAMGHLSTPSLLSWARKARRHTKHRGTR